MLTAESRTVRKGDQVISCVVSEVIVERGLSTRSALVRRLGSELLIRHRPCDLQYRIVEARQALKDGEHELDEGINFSKVPGG